MKCSHLGCSQIILLKLSIFKYWKMWVPKPEYVCLICWLQCDDVNKCVLYSSLSYITRKKNNYRKFFKTHCAYLHNISNIFIMLRNVVESFNLKYCIGTSIKTNFYNIVVTCCSSNIIVCFHLYMDLALYFYYTNRVVVVMIKIIDKWVSFE